MAHERLSPSGAADWLLCAGRPRMEAGYPDTDNEYSLRGTAAHSIGSICLEDDKFEVPIGASRSIPVTTATGDMEIVELDQEDLNAVNVYLDYIARRIVEVQPTYTAIESKADPFLWLSRDDCSGTVDYMLCTTEFIEIIDYKHGVGLVEVKDNKQLLLYALGKVGSQKEVRLTIVQPRGRHPDGPVRSWDLEVWELFAWIETFKEGAARTDDPEAPLTPGESQCRWCKAKGECPALTAQVMDVFKPVTPEPAPMQSEQGNSGTDWTGVDQSLGRPANLLSMEEITTILEKEDIIRSWLKGVRDRATVLAEEGTEIPGYKLVRSSTHRKWSIGDKDIVKKLSSVKDREGIKVARREVVTEEPISIAQAEKVLKPRLGERTWKNIEKLVIKPEGAPTLVPVTDKREPIKQAEQVFEPVPGTQPEPVAAAPWD